MDGFLLWMCQRERSFSYKTRQNVSIMKSKSGQIWKKKLKIGLLNKMVCMHYQHLSELRLNVLLYNGVLVLFIMPPTFLGRGIMKWWPVSVCPSIRLSVCPVPRSNSRTERPTKPKISKMEAYHMSNPWTYLEVIRSKVEVTRPINAVTDNAPHAGRGITIFLKLTCSVWLLVLRP